MKNILIILRSKTATVGLLIVLFWVFVALFAPLLTPYTPTYQDWENPNQGPSANHPLGTDELGRDLWARLIYGARGIELTRKLTESRPGIGVLLISGHSDGAPTDLGALPARTAFLPKPFTLNDCLERLDEVIHAS